MRAIEIEGLAVFGIIAFVGLIGYSIKSCQAYENKEHQIDAEHQEQSRELALKEAEMEAKTPCRSFVEFVSRDDVLGTKKGFLCPKGMIVSDTDRIRLDNLQDVDHHITVACQCVPTVQLGPSVP